MPEGPILALSAVIIQPSLADPPPVTSFTFGCPPAEVISALQDAGSLVAVTVTSPGER
jgi:NAD(P)H-dependent flavin oxidoreductase YrpB (nitropropane dioxygenase family)